MKLIKEKLKFDFDQDSYDFVVLAAAMFHPYWKSTIQAKFCNIVDPYILKQLHDEKMKRCYEEFVDAGGTVTDEERCSDDETETQRPNKLLKFDYEEEEDVVPRGLAETADDEYKRYVKSKLTPEERVVLFGDKVFKIITIEKIRY